VCSQLFFWKEPYWLAHHQKNWNIRHYAIDAILWTLVTKCKKCAPYNSPFQSMYIKIPYGIILRCFITSWGTTWKLGEPFENHVGTRKKKSLHPFAPKKIGPLNAWPHKCMLSLLTSCMKFLFPKLFVTIFGLG